jgi:hypothetical protein
MGIVRQQPAFSALRLSLSSTGMSLKVDTSLIIFRWICDVNRLMGHYRISMACAGVSDR